ncbi:type IV secretory system conjugative DNA transfer family protein [Rhizobium sp. Nf11,1]|uniref:type IV secretory system conjugative DNA transfer family protein n=1 Tax=Rhizobium sp. Nf11,1 TaxID=3404923 RepID=UPI003D3509A3
MKFCIAITIWPFTVACRFFWYFFISVLWNCWEALRFPLAAWRRYKNPPQPTHGNAQYETDKSLKKKGYFKNYGFLACVTDKGRHVFTRPERTVVMLAPPGIGKSLHFMADIRAKMKRPDAKLPHLVIGDASDELFRNCANILKERGYQTFKISVPQPDDWSKYDILSDLDTRMGQEHILEQQIDNICRLLVPDEKGTKQPHFYEFARLLVKCAIAINVKYEGNNKPIAEILIELIDEEKRSAMIKRAARYDDPIVSVALKTMERMQDKPEGLSMITTSLRKFEGWTNSAVRGITNYGTDVHGNYSRGWRFEQLLMSETPVALFIHSGTNKTAAGPLVRLIYGNAINAVSTILDSGRKMPRELEVMIDEAGLAGYCDAISHAFNRLRKAGVRIRMCFLSLNEFETIYPDAGDIISGSDLITFGSSNELKLADLISKLTGEYTVQSKSESESQNGESRGRSEQPRARLKPFEWRSMEEGRALALLNNIIVMGRQPWKRVVVRKVETIKFL